MGGVTKISGKENESCPQSTKSGGMTIRKIHVLFKSQQSFQVCTLVH